MIKNVRIIGCLLLFSSTAFAIPANTGMDNMYISGGLGISKLKNVKNSNLPIVSKIDIEMTEENELGLQFKNGERFRGALGVQLEDFRTELEFSHLKAKYKHVNSGYGEYGLFDEDLSGKIQLNAVMLNCFYDFNHLNPRLAPFVGAGIGLARIKNQITLQGMFDVEKGKMSEKKLAGQLSAGLKLNLTENLSLLIDYRLFSTTKVKALERRLQDQSVNLGLMVRF